MVDENKVVNNDNDRVNKTVVNLFKNKKSKKSTNISNIGAIEELNSLTLNAKKRFNHLYITFIKAFIFQHFNLKSYIWIEINELSYAISVRASKK